MNHPLLSIIVPCYNHEKYLKECLESIKNQTFDDYEVIIVDDNSQDGTSEIAKKYLVDCRFNYYKNTTNIGATKNFNKGLKLAIGKYIVFLSGDDYWADNFLQRSIETIENGGYDYVFCRTVIVNDYNETLSLIPLLEDALNSGKGIYHKMLYGNIIAGHSIVFKKTFINTCGYFNESLRYYSDWEFFLRLTKYCQGKYIFEHLAYYRMHGNNLILKQFEDESSLAELQQILSSYLEDNSILLKKDIFMTNILNHAASCIYNFNYQSARQTINYALRFYGVSVFKSFRIAICYILSLIENDSLIKLLAKLRGKKFRHV